MLVKKNNRPLLQLVLIPLACLFLFPLLWMISTSLKPVEQAMVMPPVWLPTASYAPIDGVSTRVVVRGTNDTEKVIVRLDDGRYLAAAPDEYSNGVVRVSKTNARGETIATTLPADKIKTVPPGWTYVIEEVGALGIDTDRRWDYVPPGQVTTRIEFAWRNYAQVFQIMPFWLYTLNTLILCLLCVAGTTLSNSLVAYGFSRIEWPGRDIYFAITLATMMVPFPVTMIALYGVFKSIGWVGSLRPLWVPTFFASAFNIFLLRQFYLTIPRDLSEAARIDGCSEFQIYWRIILPLTKPALAVVALFQFMGTWNDFMGPLLYLNDQSKFTLALGLQFFQSQQGGTEWHLLMAASTLVVLPVLVLFFFTQKQFIQGIATTGMKG
jgi:multiple sugar transport system permease protein